MGHVSGIFCVRGEVRLFLYNPESELLSGEQTVTLLLPDGARRSARLKTRPGAGKRILGKIEGVRTREEAAALHGAEILLPKSAMPPLEEDTYYHHQLLGVEVRTVSGALLGRLREIITSGSVDLWVISTPREDIYIPAVGDEVISVTPNVEIIVAD